ncbi:hypothetical protein CFC21_071847 [Triticum aestivum]|uniref:F-box protein AT5G49610-like beta-propeller domain-containing protein n=2 Tax=Triticum aestivum TaxID=4565 RepID=A0A3B6LLA5_WHEAT|nr:uncharacterized protein LOC123112153 [Triticum aestivum]KAF7065774.1 hypothetical protein CFC21_071847 [Triticum aestivum]
MASELGLPPPAKGPPATFTTISAISDDLLCEIFLLLPSLPSLVRAALACRTFLNAVRSSPAFRRRFRALHPPQLLGFFGEPCRAPVPPFVPLRSRSDPDLAAAVRGSDFFLTRLPEDSGDSTLGWKLHSFHAGYVVLAKDATHQIAAYNPVTQALHLLPRPPEEILFSDSLEAHIVFPEEDQRVFRMVCVQHQSTRQRAPACVAVFSTVTREWQVFPWVETPPPPPHDIIKFYPGTQLNGFVYWKHTSRPYVLVLNTATVQFSRLDLPPFLGQISSTRFRLGQTKDGMLCMVGIDLSDAERGTLHVWLWRADDDGVQKWVLGDTFLLTTFIDATKDDPTVYIEAVIDGFVYLSTKYDEYTDERTGSLLSLCLETAKLSKLFGDSTYVSPAHPYIMAWPPSLVCNKGDSQTMVSGESVADAAPVGMKETSSVHASASPSYKFD